MASGLTAPTNDLDLNNGKLNFKHKCHAYYALGHINTEDIPTSRTTYTALYSGTPKFKPLGDLVKDPLEFKWTREKLELHTGKRRGALECEGSCKTINIHPDLITLLDSAELDGEISILLVPFSLPAVISATDPLQFVCFSGVYLIDSGGLNGNGKFGEANLEFFSSPETLGETLKMSWITTNT